MKVLLISDNENILSTIDKTLRNNGFDTIIYQNYSFDPEIKIYDEFAC